MNAEELGDSQLQDTSTATKHPLFPHHGLPFNPKTSINASFLNL